MRGGAEQKERVGFRSLGRERWRVEEGISRLICLFPHADAPCWKLSSSFLSTSLSGVKPQMRASITETFSPPSPNTSPGVGNIFRLSPLWLCVYGVVLTKKDLVQALSVCLKAGLCDVAVLPGRASKPCILYLCNVASIKRLLYCLFLWLPISDAVKRKVALHANECHWNLSRLTAACVMKYTAATGVTWLSVCELGPLSWVFQSSVDRVYEISAGIFICIDLSIWISHLCYGSHFTTEIRRLK